MIGSLARIVTANQSKLNLKLVLLGTGFTNRRYPEPVSGSMDRVNDSRTR